MRTTGLLPLHSSRRQWPHPCHWHCAKGKCERSQCHFRKYQRHSGRKHQVRYQRGALVLHLLGAPPCRRTLPNRPTCIYLLRCGTSPQPCWQTGHEHWAWRCKKSGVEARRCLAGPGGAGSAGYVRTGALGICEAPCGQHRCSFQVDHWRKLGGLADQTIRLAIPAAALVDV